jgi:hypothetical protein
MLWSWARLSVHSTRYAVTAHGFPPDMRSAFLELGPGKNRNDRARPVERIWRRPEISAGGTNLSARRRGRN